MSREERARDVEATISHLASTSFAGFELSYDVKTRSWRCRHPNHGNHAFRVYLYPGLVVMWGDLGEYTFVHGDQDSLRWFLSQGTQDEQYPDYFLSKLRAVSGAPAKEFYIGDAHACLEERIADVDAAHAAEVAGLDDDDEAGRAKAADVATRDRKPFEAVRDRFKELLLEQVNEERMCWYLAWVDATGDGDPPECESWTSTALWAWHAARVFARLHGEAMKLSRSLVLPVAVTDSARAQLLRSSQLELSRGPDFVQVRDVGVAS